MLQWINPISLADGATEDLHTFQVDYLDGHIFISITVNSAENLVLMIIPISALETNARLYLPIWAFPNPLLYVKSIR